MTMMMKTIQPNLPPIIELRYRLYAVTDQDGDADSIE